MNASTSPKTNLPVIAGRTRLLRWLLGMAAVFAFLYLLLCTYLWNIVYGIFFVFMTNNAPNAEAAASPWCEPGDWILENFQPMVSDKKMIEYLQKNRTEMVRVAEMAARKRDVDKAGNYVPVSGFKEAVRKLDLRYVNRSTSWAERPYSMEDAQTAHTCITNVDTVIKPATQAARNQALEDCRVKEEAIGRDLGIVHLEPMFGKTFAQYFCSTARNSTKGYVYFPGGAPRIEDGRLMSMPSYRESHRVIASAPSLELVDSTDVDPRGRGTVIRQIDERWFISRH